MYYKSKNLILFLSIYSCSVATQPNEMFGPNYIPRVPDGAYAGPLGRFLSVKEVADRVIPISRIKQTSAQGGTVRDFHIKGQSYSMVIDKDVSSIAICAGNNYCPPQLMVFIVQSSQTPFYHYQLQIRPEKDNDCYFIVYAGLTEQLITKHIPNALQYEWGCSEKGYVWAELIDPKGNVYERDPQNNALREVPPEKSWILSPKLIRANIATKTTLYNYILNK